MYFQDYCPLNAIKIDPLLKLEYSIGRHLGEMRERMGSGEMGKCLEWWEEFLSSHEKEE